MEAINKIIQKTIPSPEPSTMSTTKILEFYETKLTPKEIYEALRAVFEKKEAERKYKAWQEEISKPKTFPKHNAEQLYQIALKKGRDLLGKNKEGEEIFNLNPEEVKIYKLAALYFAKDPSFEELGYSLKKGLMLCGNIGCGKTTLMSLFRINPNQSYFVTSVRAVVDDYKAKDGGVHTIDKYSDNWTATFETMYGHKEVGICFDDLGTEATAKHFGNELNVMCEIILNRYESAKGPFTHITTNLNAEQLGSNYGDRARSRMREMFNMITFPSTLKDKRK